MADQNSQFMAILTAVGEARLANATALGVPWNITQLGVGDGNGAEPMPIRTQTALINERRRAPINQLSIDPNNGSIIIAEQVIPEDIGGWWIREIGLYDEAGDLVAVANCPPTYKPELAQGSGRTQVVRLNILVSSTQSISLKIDPSVVLATRKYVDDLTVRADQAEAEAGAENTKGMTSLRVRQSILAWWNSATSFWGRAFVALPDSESARTTLGLGTAAIRNSQDSDYDTTASRLMINGAHGLGGDGSTSQNIAESINEWRTNFRVYNNNTAGAPDAASGTILNIAFPNQYFGTQIIMSLSGEMFFRAGDYRIAPLRKIYHDGNISTASVAEAARLSTDRFIGGVPFNGTESINLPGVNLPGNQNTTGNAGTATKLKTPRTINNVPFDGTESIIVTAEATNAIGVGQNWQDVTASRATSTTYTNTTGKPIMIHFLGNLGAGGGLFVNGIQIKFDTADTESITAIIPVGASYSVVSQIKEQWLELR